VLGCNICCLETGKRVSNVPANTRYSSQDGERGSGADARGRRHPRLSRVVAGRPESSVASGSDS
jgi:hypothetical protein